jgi:hypothetical protein
MAARFVERIQSRVGEPVSEAEVLTAMQKIPTKSISMEKVVTRVKRQRASTRQRSTARRTTRKATRSVRQSRTAGTSATMMSSSDNQREPRTTLEKLESVLQENWQRAETEGFKPNRMSAEAFVNAIHQFTDRREGTRQRILKAAEQLDRADVVLTPALVADVVHELFAS